MANNKVLIARKELVVFKRTTMVELERLLEQLPFKVKHEITKQKFVFPNGSELHYSGLGTEKDREKLKGLELGMLAIDEASEISRDIFLIASARLRHKPAARLNRLKVRLTSNPEPGWLKEDFIDSPRTDPETGEQFYFYIPSTIKDNPHLPPEYAKNLRQIYANDPKWEKAYLEGNWDAVSTQNQVLLTHWVKDAMERQVQAGWPCTWGIDVARMGNDKTVLFQRRGMKFEMLGTWAKQTLDITADNIASLYKSAEIKPRQIFLDDIGVGGGLVDILHRKGLPVVGLNVGRPAKQAERFYNLKAELWWNFRRLCESGEIGLPNDVELKTALTSIRYDYNSGSQKIQIEDKAMVKAKLGRSPDEADALVLAAWEGTASYVLYERPEDRKPINVYTASPDTIEAKRRQSINKLLRALR